MNTRKLDILNGSYRVRTISNSKNVEPVYFHFNGLKFVNILIATMSNSRRDNGRKNVLASLHRVDVPKKAHYHFTVKHTRGIRNSGGKKMPFSIST